MGLLKKYSIHRRGGFIYPPKRVVSVRAIHSSILFTVTIIIWRVAVEFVQDGTVGRICKSAPTIFVNLVARSGLIGAEP